jgi:hypothetical protein
MLQVKDESLVAGAGAYVLLVLAPVLLKLAGLPFFAAMSWQKATVLVWGPWLMSLGFWLALGLVSVGQRLQEKRQAKLTINKALTAARS